MFTEPDGSVQPFSHAERNGPRLVHKARKLSPRPFGIDYQRVNSARSERQSAKRLANGPHRAGNRLEWYGGIGRGGDDKKGACNEFAMEHFKYRSRCLSITDDRGFGEARQWAFPESFKLALYEPRVSLCRQLRLLQNNTENWLANRKSRQRPTLLGISQWRPAVSEVIVILSLANE